MKKHKYKITVHIINSQPVKVKNLVAFFGAIENEYNTQLGKAFKLNFENCPTELAVSEVKSGSQIFEIIAVVGACTFPALNEEVLLSLFNYMKAIFKDFSDTSKKDLEKYDKNSCKNVANVTQLFLDDYKLMLEMNIFDKNNEVKEIKIDNQTGRTISNNAILRIQELDKQDNEKFENAHLIFFQTRNDKKSSTGDRVIISSIDSKPHKVSFMDNEIKKKLLNSKENIYKALYKANGYVKYKGEKIHEYVVYEMSILRDGENND